MSSERGGAPTAVLRYHSERMLSTLDLTTMTLMLLEEYGAPLDLRIEPMSPAEVAEVTDAGGIVTAVRERFFLLEGGVRRRRDLEERAVRKGQK